MNLQNLIAARLGGKEFGTDTEIYKFEKIKRAKRKFLNENPGGELLDFGVGEPDFRPPDEICQKLADETFGLKKHGYTDTGTPAFRTAAAKFYGEFFGVENLNPQKNILPTIGSKEALANFAKTLIDAGDVVIQTIPGYPILATNAKYLGAEIFNLKLKKANNFLPNFTEIPAEILRRAKILVLNFPNNPTGTVADLKFWKTAVDFCLKNEIALVSDAAYSTIFFDAKPVSVLEIPGAMECAIEFFSFSKSFVMTGWRLGFAAGNEKLISALAVVKDNCDSGSFEAIQKAGIFALENWREFIPKLNEIWRGRLNSLRAVLTKFGFEIEKPRGTFFQIANCPSEIAGEKIDSAETAARILIERAGIVCVPWDESSEKLLRFCGTFGGGEILEKLEKKLGELKLKF
jgi:LL-diaminopimelate aminotransferase